MDVVLNALTLGSLYCLLAVGLSLVYGVIGIPHFAHAGVVASVALVVVYLQRVTSIGFALQVLIALAVGGALAVAVERIAYAPIVRKSRGEAAGPAVALGVLMALESGNLLIWGGDPHIVVTPYSSTSVDILGASTSGVRLALVAWAVVAIAALQVFLKRSRTGRSIVAVSQDQIAARLMGIGVRRTYMAAFFISGLLAGAAALAYGSLKPAYPYMADNIILDAFVVVIIGGMGSVYGAIVGGVLVAGAEVAGSAYLSAEYAPVYSFIVLILVLSIKPSGLFGRKVRAA